MYYYLIYNSSIGNHYELEKRYLTTILYASILYILTHAFLSSSQSEFAKKIRNYFWMIFILDCCSMSYIYYFDSAVFQEGPPRNATGGGAPSF